MRTCIKNLFLLPALIAGLGLIPAGRVTAQTFTTLYSFTAVSGSGANSDGAWPYAVLILLGNTLYGTTQFGGSSGKGTVFAVSTNGTGFTNLHSFTATSGSLYTNSDGADPWAGLILSGNTLYGTAFRGGSSGTGTVFAVSTDGMGFTNLHSFNGSSDGARPYAGLILSGNTLGQHPVWDGVLWRQWGQWHGVRRQHRWHGFYDPALFHFHGNLWSLSYRQNQQRRS